MGYKSLPGQGSGVKASEFAQAKMEVFEFDWLEYENPQPEKLPRSCSETSVKRMRHKARKIK